MLFPIPRVQLDRLFPKGDSLGKNSRGKSIRVNLKNSFAANINLI
jgi:hypothetical protein